MHSFLFNILNVITVLQLPLQNYAFLMVLKAVLMQQHPKYYIGWDVKLLVPCVV